MSTLDLSNIRLAVAACHKCHCMVAPANNAVFLEIIRQNTMILGVARHLFPVVVNGDLICEGSPSRVQYLEGQPRDTRPQGRYLSDLERPYRDAYAKLQELAAN